MVLVRLCSSDSRAVATLVPVLDVERAEVGGQRSDRSGAGDVLGREDPLDVREGPLVQGSVKDQVGLMPPHPQQTDTDRGGSPGPGRHDCGPVGGTAGVHQEVTPTRTAPATTNGGRPSVIGSS